MIYIKDTSFYFHWWKLWFWCNLPLEIPKSRLTFTIFQVVLYFLRQYFARWLFGIFFQPFTFKTRLGLLGLYFTLLRRPPSSLIKDSETATWWELKKGRLQKKSAEISLKFNCWDIMQHITYYICLLLKLFYVLTDRLTLGL